MKYEMTWYESQNVVEGSDLSVSQVYCWIYTIDKKIALVSKDNKNWQFPGGKPKENEGEIDTLERELNEEISLSLKNEGVVPKMFGYYVVSEFNDDNELIRKYLQLRYLVKLKCNSNDLAIKPNENVDEIENDKIIISKWFSINEALNLIPWLSDSKELRSFLAIK